MTIDIDISQRETSPRWLDVVIPLLTIGGSLILSSILLIVSGINPARGYYVMFVQTLAQPFSQMSVLVKLVPLALAGLAVYIPRRANLWNIGAEGQLYVGAMAGTWVAITFEAPAALLLPAILLTGAISGGLWGFIPGYLRGKYGANEIIVTLMMTFIAIQINEYLIQGPLQPEQANFPGSALLPATATLPTWGDTSLHAGIAVVVLTVVLTWLLISKSRFGYETIMIGSNPKAAAQSGINRFRVYTLTLVTGGMMAGVAGIIEISAVQGRLISDFSPGYGFTAIPIALLGRSGAGRVLLAALFFAVLFVGGQSLSIVFDIQSSLVEVIQALVIFFLITGEFLRQFKIGIRVGDVPVTELFADRTAGER